MEPLKRHIIEKADHQTDVVSLTDTEEQKMEPLKKYIIEKAGYQTTVVSLTEREANAISQFIDWAETDEEFYITPVEEYEAEEWGKDPDSFA